MSSPQENPRIKVGPYASRPTPDTIPVGMVYVATDKSILSVIVGPGTPHIWDEFVSGAGAINPFSHVLYVDGGTTTLPADATGSVGQPFKTIMAAVAAMKNGTTIQVMPGLYPENVVWPDLNDTSLLGLDAASVVIAPPSGDAFVWAPAVGAVITNFNMTSLTLKVTGVADRAIFFDGTNTPDFLTGLGTLENVFVTHPGGGDAILVQRVNTFRIVNSVNFTGGNTSLLNIGQGIVEGHLNTGGALVISWDITQPIPTIGRVNTVVLQATVLGQIILDGAPFVIVNRDVIVLFSVTDSGLVFDGINAPNLIFSGTIGLFGLIPGGMSLAYPTVPAGQSSLDMPGADIFGAVVLSVAAGPRLPVKARDVVWRNTGAGSVSIGDLIDMDARGSSYPNQSIFSVSGSVDKATLDRDTWGIYGQPVGGFGPGATTLTITPPFPAGTTEYCVTPNTTNPVSVAIPPGTKLANQFDADASAATGPVDFMIVRAQAT